jgi:hypothetical protein
MRDAILKRQQTLSGKLDRPDTAKAVIVAVDGSVWFDQARRLVWVQRVGDTAVPMPAYNRNVKAQVGIPVLLEIMEGSQFSVIRDIDAEVLANPVGVSAGWLQSAFLTDHHDDHEPGGNDQMWLYPEAFTPLAVVPGSSGLTVTVISGYYEANGVRIFFAGAEDEDISAGQPASGEHRFMGVYIDDTNALGTVNGTAVTEGTDAEEPTWPAGATPLAVVDLDGTQTDIQLRRDIFNRRAFVTAGGGVTDHGALTGLADDDHSQYHNDSRGDARYSQLSHSHSGLAPAGGSANQVLKKDTGTDYDYSWQDEAGGGVTDHGALTGLADDDHSQYYNQTRGDARYLKLSDYTDAAVLAKVKNVDGAGSGLDADTVDGLSSERLVQGDNATRTTQANDWTVALPSGFYNEYAAYGAPTATWYHMIASRHSNFDNNFQMQLAGEFFSANELYYRIISNNTPSSWARMWHSLNDGSGSGLDADLLDGFHYDSLMSTGTVVQRTTDLSLTAGAWNTIAFQSAHYEQAAWADWDTATAIYAAKSGLYLVTGQVKISPFSGSQENCAIQMLKNGTNIYIYTQIRNQNYNTLIINALGVYYFSASQYLQMQVLASAGGSPVANAYYTKMGLVFLGA